MVRNSLTKKEKRVFLAGVAIALAGGFIANIAVKTLYDFIGGDYSMPTFITMLTANFFLWSICIYILIKLRD